MIALAIILFIVAGIVVGVVGSYLLMRFATMCMVRRRWGW